jgi:hypothetical protein
LIEPKAKNEPVDWDKVAMFRTEVEKTVGYLENVWLKDRNIITSPTVWQLMDTSRVFYKSFCGLHQNGVVASF